MRIIEYTDSSFDQWESFIDKATNGTIFHKQRFLSYHPANRFTHRHIMFYKGKELIAVMTGVDWKEGKKRIYISHKGASYGGFVVRNGLGIKDAIELVETFLWWCSNKGYNEVILTQTPQIYYSVPHNHIDFALMKNGATFLKRELTSALRILESIDENFSLFSPEARTATRKAIKNGVEVLLTEEYDKFYTILERNLSMRHNVKPTHSLDELKHLHTLFPKDILLWGATYKGKLIAGVLTMRTNNNVLLAFYISHDEKYQSLRPINILFYRIIEYCIKNGFKYLDFGTYTLNMEPNFGLAHFKEGFGAQGIFRDTYRIVF